MKKIPLTIALAALCSAAPALAHHPFAAEYDWKKPVTLSGTVDKFDWKNPHSMLQVNGKDDKGTEGEWTIELGGPGQLSRAGWNSHEFKTGDKVTVDGWMAKSGQKQVNAKSVTLTSGRQLSAASSFYQGKGAPETSATPKATSGTAVPKPKS